MKAANILYMWLSRVEIEECYIVCLNSNIPFEVLYCQLC